ncbi:hypothetical protein CSB69_2231 [Morganella morganii]|nr:hypothetical protein CSB69_2231 [Morganella morganii]EMP50388.1 hypothetical protein C790_02268 [Morganella morganii SC01]
MVAIDANGIVIAHNRNSGKVRNFLLLFGRTIRIIPDAA